MLVFVPSLMSVNDIIISRGRACVCVCEYYGRYYKRLVLYGDCGGGLATGKSVEFPADRHRFKSSAMHGVFRKMEYTTNVETSFLYLFSKLSAPEIRVLCTLF